MATSFILLAAAVFLWGLEYKVSLYPGHGSSRVQVAKLLSERERPVTAAASITAQRSATPVLVWLAWMLAVANFSRLRMRRVATPPACPGWAGCRVEFCCDYFSFRPPPPVSL
ncbi:MAG: hypothetical protein WA414_17070 [Acidobacteriaceae bacterium]